MKMKTLNLIAFIALMFCISFFVNLGYASGADFILSTSLSTYEPYPAEPGDYVNLKVVMRNTGAIAAENATFELLPEYPFSMDSSDSPTKNYGKFPSGEQIMLSYRIRVDENAVTGTQPLKLRYRASNNEIWIVTSYNITIRTIYATLAVDKVELAPSVISPGEKGTVTIVLDNMANSFLRDISVKLDTSSSSLALAPVGSTTEKKIKTIAPRAIKNVSFDIFVLSSAESNVYKVPLTITYYDDLGNNYTKIDTVGIIVGGQPDITAEIDETSVQTKGKTGEVKIDLINKGLLDAKFLEVELKKSSDYEILSSNPLYLGNLDSDDSEIATFKLFINKDADKNAVLPLTLKFKDANNVGYTTTENINLRIYDSREIRKYGLNNGSRKGTWLLIVILIIGGALLYKKVWKKRKLKREK